MHVQNELTKKSVPNIDIKKPDLLLLKYDNNKFL